MKVFLDYFLIEIAFLDVKCKALAIEQHILSLMYWANPTRCSRLLGSVLDGLSRVRGTFFLSLLRLLFYLSIKF